VGVPDRIVLLNNQVWFVELKTASGRVSKRQEIVFDAIGENGFPVHILRSKEDCEEFVNATMQNVRRE
jgi:hypothetical protein